MTRKQKDETAKVINKTSSEVVIADEFKALFEADKYRLYSYIHAFVSDSTAADDIFQETSLTLWKSFSTFELGSSFSKWANSIAFRRVLVFRRKNKKYALGLSDDFLAEFSESLIEFESLSAQQEQKLDYLEHCRALLPEPLQRIFHHFYIDNHTAPEIANATGRSVHAIRKAVHKMRQKIFDCVDDKEQEDL